MDRLKALLDSPGAKRLLSWLGRLVTLAIVGYLVYKLGKLGWKDLWAALPSNAWFYVLFVLIYVTQPLAELLIYRQFWPIPLPSGIRALIKKRVFNEEMAGYSGEVYFFWWLHHHFRIGQSEAFKAVRDINILSSVASITVALGLLGVLSAGGILELERIFGNVGQAQILIGLGILVAVVAILTFFRRFIFSLPRKMAYRILSIHYGRLLIVNSLVLLQWSVGVPAVGIVIWLTYLSLLIILNRVPFLPSKDLFFLSLGIGLAESMGQATTAIAGMLLASSVLVRTTNITLFLVAHFGDRRWKAEPGAFDLSGDGSPSVPDIQAVPVADSVRINVLVWATTFGSDLWSLTRYLDQRADVRLRVVMDDPETFKTQGVANLFPLRAEIVARKWYHHLPSRRWDLTVMDNRIPRFRTSRKALILWHGFGWKGPNDEEELWLLHLALRWTWGDIRKPNEHLRWQSFGPWDSKHRTEVSGIHPDNCLALGAASHDDLTVPLDRNLAQPFYPFDIVGRKTILIAPTWHYGEVFAHWGTDADLFDQLLARIHDHGANAIVRLHDSFRFDQSYLSFLAELTSRYPNVCLKFKDLAPDNYLDLQVADVLITNFSSIANLFYATRRPTLHIYPVRSADEAFIWRELRWSGVKKKHLDKAKYIWKLPPEENGGLLARSFAELLEQLDRAIADPECCRDVASDFLDRHMLGADGRNRERVWEVIEELVAT